MRHFKLLLPLLLLLLMSSPSIAQNADSANYYLKLAAQDYQAKDYQKAAQGYISALRHYPGYTAAVYNTACCYSLLNNQAEAIRWLEKAVDLGYYKFDQDQDLNNIRSTKQYRKILARAQMLAAELKNKMDNPVIGLPQDMDTAKTYGLLVALHGYGSDPNNIMQALAGVPQQMGYIVLAPYGHEPAGRDGYSWGDRDTAEQRVLAAIKNAQAQYKIDPSKLILMGFSQGATTAYYIGTKNAALFKGIIPMAGMYDSSLDQFLPRSRENNLKVYIMFGELESEAMIKSNLEAIRSFIMSGVTASFNVYARLGHAFPPNHEFELRRAIEWIEK
ncbi:dienelactone hydrolase family protein [candidate division TA06 bacterium]|nr:dienelactone hydrolase family protein [candidate division TA06 bacterium]